MLMFYTAMLSEPKERRKFEELYLQHRQTLYRVAYRILQDPHDAEDAVHHAFVRLVDHMDKVDVRNLPRTRAFLLAVVENAAIDIYRQRKRKSGVRVEELCLPEPMPEEIADSIAFDRAFLKLPVIYSSVLRLKYSHGYSGREIAVLLGLTEENVRQRIYRGKQLLAELLEKEGISL